MCGKQKDSESRVISLHFRILYCHGCVEIFSGTNSEIFTYDRAAWLSFEIGCICVGSCGNIVTVFGLNPTVCVCVYVRVCVCVCVCVCVFHYKLVVKYRKLNVIQIQ